MPYTQTRILRYRLPAQAYARWLLAVVVCVWVAGGCSGESNRVPLTPVQGSLRVRGEPASGAKLIFHPVNERQGLIPLATVGDDGNFLATTYETGDGMPPGEYVVTAVWQEPKPPGSAIDAPAGPDRLNGRYARTENSPWKVSVGSEPIVLEPFVVD